MSACHVLNEAIYPSSHFAPGLREGLALINKSLNHRYLIPVAGFKPLIFELWVECSTIVLGGYNQARDVLEKSEHVRCQKYTKLAIP
jgi:hypothetical protein